MDEVIIGILFVVELFFMLGVGLIATFIELFFIFAILYQFSALKIIKIDFSKFSKNYNPKFTTKEIVIIFILSVINSFIFFCYIDPFIYHSNIIFMGSY